MKRINITNGEYLNNYLQSKYEGIFIPFNEAIIQGDLLYPLFDNNYIYSRSKVHKVDASLYKEKLNGLLEIKEYINEIESITLWFGKDAFCVINLLTVLVYLQDLNYICKLELNIVDDETNIILQKGIQIESKDYRSVYLNLFDRKFITTNIDVIDGGLKDYLYITSRNNHIVDYIKSNIETKSKKELLLDVLSQTAKYGLSDLFILDMIEKIK